MRVNGLEAVFYIDSDVLLYSSLDEILAIYGPKLSDSGLLVPQQTDESFRWAVNGAAAYWRRATLSSFCSFALRSYKEPDLIKLYWQKWKWHQENSVPGGICDMTALYLFWRTNQHLFLNFAEQSGGTAFDANFNSANGFLADEYVTEEGHKAVVFKNDQPYCRRANDGGLVRFHALHLQGGAKSMIPQYYRGPRFPGQVFSLGKHYLGGGAKRLVRRAFNRGK